MAKTELELTWIGKENRPKLEPRILLENPAKSYHAQRRVTDHDHFDNWFVFDNRLVPGRWERLSSHEIGRQSNPTEE
jgi:adenine-specific DNA-methyltransferase